MLERESFEKGFPHISFGRKKVEQGRVRQKQRWRLRTRTTQIGGGDKRYLQGGRVHSRTRPSTTSFGQSFWLISSPLTTTPLSRVRPDPRRPRRRQGPTFCTHPNHWCSPIPAPQGAPPGHTSPRRNIARHAAHIAGQNRAVQQVQATRGQRTVSLPSSATHLKNMVNCLGRFSAEPASLAPSGTNPLQSPPSSWPPRNTSPARSLVTPTMTMTPTMTSPPPMNRMTELEYFSSLWEAYRVSVFILFMFPPASYVEERACHSQPLFATRTRVLKSASLK